VFIEALGSSKFFVGLTDAEQVCALEEQQERTPVVFKGLAELHG